MTIRIGLTGPIGCGKSTVARWLAEDGAAVVDADAIAREVVEPGQPAFEAVAARFGPGVVGPDGSLDRAALGRIVFADPAALADLEAIVHPAVRPLIVEAVEAAERAQVPAVVVEAIKLVEAGHARECDEVWLVECAPSVARDRLAGRGMPLADARQRIEAQGSDLVERLVRALGDTRWRRIDTSGSLDATHRVVRDALREALGAR
ncbi:MAG TPA: dephospho-CoA kinase [Candidatus Limnocylindrales bacterium]|nr:dephospho-CoA kinase [Candidatus Limnocylindrales bacterium]